MDIMTNLYIYAWPSLIQLIYRLALLVGAHTFEFASAVNFACFCNSTGESPRGMYTSINLSLSGTLKALSLSRSDSSFGVWTAMDSYGVCRC